MRPLLWLAGALAAAPALAQDFPPLRATLTGYQEVPSVSTEAVGTFEARVVGDVFDPGARVEYTLLFVRLQADATMAHIHFAQEAVNGPIVVWICGSASQPGPAGTPTCPARSGVIRGLFTGPNILSSATQQLSTGELSELILAMRAGNAYVNVHTAVSPGGEIRGQIAKGNYVPK